MSHRVSLSAASEGSKEEEPPPTGRGSHSSTAPCGHPSHLWISPCPTPGWRQQDPEHEGRGSRVGTGLAGGRSTRRCLPCWSPSGAGSVTKSPRKAGWRWEGAGALCRSGLTAPQHLSSPRLVLLPARRAPAGVSRASHPGLVLPATRPAGLGRCCCEFGQAGVLGSEAGRAPPNLHQPPTGDPGKWPVGGGALPVAWVAAFY